MTALLLMSWLGTQTWQWHDVEGATSYRVYWKHIARAHFCEHNRVEFPASVCVNHVCQGEIPQPLMSPAVIVVVAVNANGESITEHGPIWECQQ